ncbi:MAG: N-acetyltransferase family protein [Planctomycetota bacterium]
MTTISPATPADVPTILTLIRELAEYERLSHAVVATEEHVHASLFGERPRAEALLARDDRAVAGFALFFHNYSTFVGRPGLYLEDLFVRPAFRGRGIGRALLAELARIAVERDCGRMEWSVLDWNVDAIGFYEKLGAQPMSEWTVFRLAGDPLRALASNARVPGARAGATE